MIQPLPTATAGGTILGAGSGLIAKGLALAVTGGTYE